jgi:2EXR family
MSRVHNLCLQLPKLEIPLERKPCEAFTTFSELPREIRDTIWKFISHVPREVIFIPKRNASPVARHLAIMHTCRESREGGKRYYTRCEEQLDSGLSRHHSPTKIIWINFAMDRFLFKASLLDPWPRHCVKFNFNKDILKQIQHITIPPSSNRSSLEWEVLPRLEYVLWVKSSSSKPFGISIKTWPEEVGPEQSVIRRHFGDYWILKQAVDRFEKKFGKKIHVDWE